MDYRHQRKKTGCKTEWVVILRHGTDAANRVLNDLDSGGVRGVKANKANWSWVVGNQIDMFPVNGLGGLGQDGWNV